MSYKNKKLKSETVKMILAITENLDFLRQDLRRKNFKYSNLKIHITKIVNLRHQRSKLFKVYLDLTKLKDV